MRIRDRPIQEAQWPARLAKSLSSGKDPVSKNTVESNRKTPNINLWPVHMYTPASIHHTHTQNVDHLNECTKYSLRSILLRHLMWEEAECL